MRDGVRDSRCDAAIIDWLVEQVAAVGAVGAVVALVSADAVALEPRWWVGYSEEVVDSWARIPIGSSTPLTDALRGDPVVVGSSWEKTTRYPVLGTRPTRGCAALAAVAVPGPSGRPVGALGLSFSTPHPRTTTPGVLLAAAQDLAALLVRMWLSVRPRSSPRWTSLPAGRSWPGWASAGAGERSGSWSTG